MTKPGGTPGPAGYVQADVTALADVRVIRSRLGATAGCAVALAAVTVALTVTACGSQAARSTAAGSTATGSSAVPGGSATATPPVSPSVPPPVSPSATASPAAIPAAVLKAVTSGTPRTIEVVPSSVLAHPAASQEAALRTARLREPRGTQIMGLSLARVKGFGFGTDMTRSQLAWLVSVDPYGGAYGAGNKACGRITYDVEIIDPVTGGWLTAAAGRQPGMEPLPILGPTPTQVQPTPACRAPVPPIRQGTPAAY